MSLYTEPNNRKLEQKNAKPSNNISKIDVESFIEKQEKISQDLGKNSQLKDRIKYNIGLKKFSQALNLLKEIIQLEGGVEKIEDNTLIQHIKCLIELKQLKEAGDNFDQLTKRFKNLKNKSLIGFLECLRDLTGSNYLNAQAAVEEKVKSKLNEYIELINEIKNPSAKAQTLINHIFEYKKQIEI